MTSYSYWVTSMPTSGATALHFPSLLGPNDMGKENSNRLFLLTLCLEEKLTITNTLFEQPEIHKATRMHPRSKHWHLINLVIISCHDMTTS